MRGVSERAEWAAPPGGPADGPAVAWKINGERLTVLGWGRAVLLQFAHPLVAAGVAEHSRFDTGPAALLGRTRRTLEAMLAFTFGPEPRARAAADRINAIHDRVHGTLAEPAGVYPAGQPYSAHDPELLAWVHATLIDSVLLAWEVFVGPLTREEKDRYCLEATAMGPRLGVPAEDLPATSEALEAYLREMVASGRICVTPTARDLAARLFSPPLGPLGPVGRPVVELLRLAAVGLLPAPIRAAYGFAWDAGRERALRTLAALVRGARRLAPRALREWPDARSFAERLPRS
ncbi:MAG TPA: oxygenase MpaB family protein [Longimicrobiales bacterium]|nr:oxygenase MpaB family protein [Longimicrobiales bacterium]